MTGKLGDRVPPDLKDAEFTLRIVDGLFPTRPVRRDDTETDETPADPLSRKRSLLELPTR